MHTVHRTCSLCEAMCGLSFDVEDNRIELYNVAADIGEEDDLAGRHPDRVRELRQALHLWRSDVDAQLPEINPDWKSPE